MTKMRNMTNKTLIKSSSPKSGGKHHVWHVLNIYISHFADFQLCSGFVVHFVKKAKLSHIFFHLTEFGIVFASFRKIHFRKKMQKFAKISWWSAKKNVHERFCSLLTLVPRDFQSGRRAQSKYVCNYLHDNIQDIH